VFKDESQQGVIAIPLNEALDSITGVDPTEDLIALAEINSGSSNLSGLQQAAGWLIENMQLGVAAERVSLPSVQLLDDSGQLVEQQTGDALVWHCRPEAKRRVLLAIHYDTVFASNHPFQSCRRLETNRWTGPGMADAKGGILVIRSALQALERFNLAEEIGWSVVLNPDEEIGSLHSTPLLNDLASQYDFGLLFEPSLPTGELVGSRGGSGNYVIAIRGQSAHVGRHFEEGKNAVAKLSGLMYELDKLNQHQGLIVNIGFVTGGGPLNVVPDFALGRFNVRVPGTEQQTLFETRYAELCRGANAAGYELTIDGGITSPAKPETPAIDVLKREVGFAFEATGNGRPTWIRTGGVCDGNKLAAAGLPNIDSLGPVGGELHSDREWVDTASINQRAKSVVTLLHRYSQREFTVTDA